MCVFIDKATIYNIECLKFIIPTYIVQTKMSCYCEIHFKFYLNLI